MLQFTTPVSESQCLLGAPGSCRSYHPLFVQLLSYDDFQNLHAHKTDKLFPAALFPQVQRLYEKYLRADSYRKALVYQKKYLLLLLGGFQDCEQTTLALIARMGAYPSPEHLHTTARHRQPSTVFRSAARVVVTVSRMRFLVKKWKRATRVGSPVMRGSVDLQQGYAPNSNSFSPPRINTQSRLNGPGPISSHASSPLHPSLQQSPYSHLSSSFFKRDFLKAEYYS